MIIPCSLTSEPVPGGEFSSEHLLFLYPDHSECHESAI